MMAARSVLAMCCAALLGACAGPVYQAQPGSAGARVRFVNLTHPGMCLDGRIFSLSPDGSGYVRVPAGAPVRFDAIFTQGTGWCSLAVTFTPRDGQTYDITNEARAEHCVAAVMRQDASAQYGFRLENSVTRALGKCQ